MTALRTLIFASAALALFAGCSSKSSGEKAGSLGGQDSGASTGPGGHPCTTRGAECLAKQMACSSDGTTESCVPCAEGKYAKDANTCADIPGTVLAHDFDTYELAGGAEIDPLCQSWSVGNDTEIWVNGVELETNGGYHHSNWLFVPDDQYPGPDGAWNCDTRGYSELNAAIAGGVLFAQSTQAKHQVQKFQDGVAVKLPPHVKIIGGTHLLNTGTDAIQTSLKLTLYELPAKDVTVPLAPFRLSYLDLTIPPNAISEFGGACDLSAVIPGGTPGDLDADLYYVMPHYHSLGHSFHLGVYGGPDDGKAIFDVGAFDGEAHGTPIDPPLSMRGKQGFRFSCGYENPRDKEVGWGIGDQEMCVMLGFMRANYAFDASVITGAAAGQNGTTFEYSGTCGAIALEFARGKGSLAPDGG